MTNLLLGDSIELIKSIPDNSIDLIVTDPPYEMCENGGLSTPVGMRLRKQKTELDDVSISRGYNYEILNDFLRVMKLPNMYIWCNGIQLPKYIQFFSDKNLKLDILIWNKTNAAPLFSRKYLTDKEYCLYFRKGGVLQP